MENENSITIKYVFDKLYNPEYCNGVYGGLTPSGELEINFYFERGALPYEVVQEVDENGYLGDIKSFTPEKRKIIRFVNSGVVLNEETALSVYNWLRDRLTEMGVDEDELRDNGTDQLE